MQLAHQLRLRPSQTAGLGQLLGTGTHAHQFRRLVERQGLRITLLDLLDLLRQRLDQNAQLVQRFAHAQHARYLAEPDFYAHKPSLATDPAGFYRYASTLSRLTGPALVTDVVDRRLPALQVLRQIINLYAIPRINTQLFLDVEACKTAMRELLPLNRIARVGGNHSWART